ncbi:outer membrane beta-barrel protein [Flavobacterium sp.]|jgi:hypothetical protein|uniref:outer membrane beta-barrel protein n=1 Tax=Flavobacterium sp. TaxID=239 RepID=UPI0037C0D080
MKNLFYLIAVFCWLATAQAQEVYFSTGKNFTTYNFKNSSGNTNSNLKNGTGNFYEVGYIQPFENEKFSYSLGLALNEYNNTGGNSANSYSWETQYLGLQGGLMYSIVDRGNFDILPKLGLNMATIVSGKQSINGTYYDLTDEKEFSGLLVTPSIGVQIKYNLSSDGFISLGYNYCFGLNPTNATDQKLSFSTNQLQFGVHYAFN